MRAGLVIVLSAAVLLGACAKKTADEVPPEALDAIAWTVADELNAPVTSIMTRLRDGRDNAQVGWNDLVIGFDGRNWPVNWWLYRHGYLDLSGARFIGGAAFTLSKKSLEMVAVPDEPWFEVDVDEPTIIDCNSPAAVSVAGCEIEAVAKPALTPAGRSAGAVTPASFTVYALVSIGLDDWEVVNWSPTGGRPVHAYALDAILGPEQNRQAAEASAALELKDRLGEVWNQMGGSDQVQTLDATPSPPPAYAEPPAPVAPIAPERPRVSGRLN